MTDTVLVVGPPLAGASSVAAALRHRLDGCAIVEPAGLRAGQIPDAVVFVTSAAAPMSDCDTALLAAAAARTDAVVAAVTKIDVHRTWRAVLDINRTASARWRRVVPWVGVAADPQVGPVVVGPLVDAVRAELAGEHRQRRSVLRAREWALQGLIAEREREVARRALLRVQAARRSAVRARVQQARLHLAGEARARSAALRADLQREAGGLSRRRLDSFDDRVHRRVQQLADDFETAVAEYMTEISSTAGTAVPALAPAPPVQSYLPPRRTAVLEDRLAAVFGTGFGLGVSLTLGRFLAEAVPGATPAIVAVCGGAGVALAGWVVHTRRLVTARAGLERWVAEVASGLRTTLQERLLTAESALVETHAAAPGLAGPIGAVMADPTVETWNVELSRVRAALDDGGGTEAGSPAFGAEP